MTKGPLTVWINRRLPSSSQFHDVICHLCGSIIEQEMVRKYPVGCPNQLRTMIEENGKELTSSRDQELKDDGQSGYLGDLHTWKNGSSRKKRSLQFDYQRGEVNLDLASRNKSGNGGESQLSSIVMIKIVELLHQYIYATIGVPIL